jgi:hypothetical protein
VNVITQTPEDDRVGFRIRGLQSDIRLRVLADDSDTGWRSIHVVPPTQLVNWRLRAAAPECLAVPDIVTSGDAAVPIDSLLTGIGATDRPLAEAFCEWQLGSGEIRRWPLDLTSDGLQISIGPVSAWFANEEGSYRLEWIDRDGVAGQSPLWQITPLIDPAPRVEYFSDELILDDQIWLGQNSRWPLRVLIEDERGWQTLSIEIQANSAASTAINTSSNSSSGSSSGTGAGEESWREVWSVDAEQQLGSSDNGVTVTRPSAEPTENNDPSNGQINTPTTQGRFELQLSAAALLQTANELDPETSQHVESVDGVRIHLRMVGVDRCGRRTVVGPLALSLVSSEAYGRVLERAWRQWLEELETWQQVGDDLLRSANEAHRTLTTDPNWDDRQVAATGEVRCIRANERLQAVPGGLLARVERLIRWGVQHQATRSPVSERGLTAQRIVSEEIVPRLIRLQTQYASLAAAGVSTSSSPTVNNNQRSLDSTRTSAGLDDAVIDRVQAWEQVVVDWESVHQQLDRILGPEGRQDWATWSTRLREIAEAQTRLQIETDATIGVTDSAAGNSSFFSLSERQGSLAADTERLMALVGERAKAGDQDAAWLSTALGKQSIANAQRDAAEELRFKRSGSARQQQAQALAGIAAVLDAGDQRMSGSQSPSSATSAATDRLRSRMNHELGEIEQLVDRFGVWRAADPTLTDPERRQSFANLALQQSRILETEIASAAEQYASAEVAQAVRRSAAELALAAEAIESGNAESAALAMDAAKEALQQAAEQTPSLNADHSTDPDQGVDASSNADEDSTTSADALMKHVLRWAERESGIAVELSTGPPQISATPLSPMPVDIDQRDNAQRDNDQRDADQSSDKTTARWLEAIADQQMALGKLVQQQCDSETLAELPILNLELLRIAARMRQVGQQLQQLSLRRTESSNDRDTLEMQLEGEWQALGKEAADLAVQLAALTVDAPAAPVPQGASGESLVVDPVTGDAESAPSLSSELRSEIGRLRTSETLIVDRLVALRETEESNQARSRDEALELAAQQAALLQAAKQLGSQIQAELNARATTPTRPTEGTPEDSAGPSVTPQGPASTLPGLPGLPGIPRATPNPSTEPSTSDEASGDESTRVDATDPEAVVPRPSEEDLFEPVLVAMESASVRLSTEDVGLATESDLRLAIAELDEWLGGAAEQNNQQGGSAASSTAGSESGVVASIQAINGGTLLPESWWGASGIWGHLPERLQESLSSGREESWIPGFERMSAEYFRRLDAEEPR